LHVCRIAVDALGDSSKFPDEWLFNHRWGKGKKEASTTLPNGAKITFLTVGGRTSCVVPSVQKKTGAVAGDIKAEEKANDTPDNTSAGKVGVDGQSTKAGKPKKRKMAAGDIQEEGTDERPAETSSKSISKRSKSGSGDKVGMRTETPTEQSRKPPSKAATSKASSETVSKPKKGSAGVVNGEADSGRRRSGRATKK
jgi:formamidopyrimidine-DNA glycosylase